MDLEADALLASLQAVHVHVHTICQSLSQERSTWWSMWEKLFLQLDQHQEATAMISAHIQALLTLNVPAIHQSLSAAQQLAREINLSTHMVLVHRQAEAAALLKQCVGNFSAATDLLAFITRCSRWLNRSLQVNFSSL